MTAPTTHGYVAFTGEGEGERAHYIEDLGGSLTVHSYCVHSSARGRRRPVTATCVRNMPVLTGDGHEDMQTVTRILQAAGILP